MNDKHLVDHTSIVSACKRFRASILIGIIIRGIVKLTPHGKWAETTAYKEVLITLHDEYVWEEIHNHVDNNYGDETKTISLWTRGGLEIRALSSGTSPRFERLWLRTSANATTYYSKNNRNSLLVKYFMTGNAILVRNSSKSSSVLISYKTFYEEGMTKLNNFRRS